MRHKISNLKSKISNLQFIVVLLMFLIEPDIVLSSGWNWIGPEKVMGMLKEGSGLWLIDIRSPMAYEAEHIEGAVNISLASLTYKKFPANKTLILIDDSLGQKAAREAAESLVRNKHEGVYILEGGTVSWRSEGHPVLGNKPLIRGVNREELKWAISNKISLRIFDMRDPSDIGKGAVEGSQQIQGKDIIERVKKLKELLKNEKSKGLSSRLRKPETIILILSPSENGAGLIENILRDTQGNIRYLIGGYEAFMAKGRQVKKEGCPTCPGKGR